MRWFGWIGFWACAGRPAPTEVPAPEVAPVDHAAAAAEAYAARDWPAFVAHQQAVADADPDSLRDRYNLACGYALAGQRDRALGELRGLLDRGVDLGAGQDPDFASLKGDPEFEALLAGFAALFPPVHHSERAFLVGGSDDLAPEGIAHDPASGRFFVGSMRTGAIFAVSEGVTAPFATLAVGEVPVSAVGLTVAGGRLWAVGTATDIHREYRPEQAGTTAVFSLDLSTGEILSAHVRPPGGRGFGFNDLAVVRDGAVYATGADLYAIHPGRDPEVLAVTPPVGPCNGIAPGAEAGVLYVGTGRQGIVRVDLEARTSRSLEHPPGVDLGSFDGLYRVDGALVGIQLGFGRWRVVRLDLDPAGTAVTAVEVLEQGTPEIAGATTGAVVGDALYYVTRAPGGADPNWGGPTEVWKTPIRP